MAKRPVPKYDFKAFGAAIKAARTGRKESRKKVSDEMFISPRYLANIENKGQHPSLQIFFELMLRYNISVKAMTAEIQKIGVNVNQIARRVNATGNAYQEDIEEIKGVLAEIWRLQRLTTKVFCPPCGGLPPPLR